jgi:hypothetical protein
MYEARRKSGNEGHLVGGSSSDAELGPGRATDLDDFLKAVGKFAIVETPFLGCTTTPIKGMCVCLQQTLDVGKAGCLVANPDNGDVGAIVSVICAVPQFDSNGDEVFQRVCPLWAPLAK